MAPAQAGVCLSTRTWLARPRNDSAVLRDALLVRFHLSSSSLGKRRGRCDVFGARCEAAHASPVSGWLSAWLCFREAPVFCACVCVWCVSALFTSRPKDCPRPLWNHCFRIRPIIWYEAILKCHARTRSGRWSQHPRKCHTLRSSSLMWARSTTAWTWWFVMRNNIVCSTWAHLSIPITAPSGEALRVHPVVTENTKHYLHKSEAIATSHDALKTCSKFSAEKYMKWIYELFWNICHLKTISCFCSVNAIFKVSHVQTKQRIGNF